MLSRSFVNSVWCNYELYFAQQRAIGKTFSDVILIVKEPIDPTSLPSKFCKLKKMLSTKTYLEWPQQPTEQSFFWVQLRSVLGKPNVIRQRTTSQRSRLSSVRSVSLIELPQNQNSADEDGHQVSDQPSNRCQQTLREIAWKTSVAKMTRQNTFLSSYIQNMTCILVTVTILQWWSDEPLSKPVFLTHWWQKDWKKIILTQRFSQCAKQTR